MTAISIAGQHEFACPICGHVSTPTVWLAIDLIERPDLRAHLEGGAWRSVACPSCGAASRRGQPLLVTRLDPVAPVVLALPSEDIDIGEVLKSLDPLMRQVQEALGSARSTTPGPIVPLAFDALSLAASRDLRRDVDDPDLEMPAVEGGHDSYGRFVDRVRKTSDRRHLQLALGLLHQVDNRVAFEKLLREYPELLTDAALAELAAGTDTDDLAQRHMAVWQALLTDAAAGDAVAAWARFEAAVRGEWTTHWGPRIERLMTSIAAAGARSDWAALHSAADELATIAKSAGIKPLEVEGLMSAGSALLETASRGRPDGVEQAVAYLEEARAIVDQEPGEIPRALAVTVLSHLAIAYGTRTKGDPRANQERAIECLERALALAPRRDRDLQALIRTNLAYCLIGLAAELTAVDQWTEDAAGDNEAAARIDEAIEQLRKALKRRSFSRDPLDWAYTETNLGLAYSRRLTGNREDNLRRALAHQSNAARGFEAAGEQHLVAHALRNLSAVEFSLMQLETSDEGSPGPRLGRALSAAKESLATRPATVAPVEAGRTWLHLGRIYEAASEADSAIDAYSHALETLTPATSARDCRDAARALANLVADRDGWGASAGAWETAARATAQAADMCSTSGARMHELHAHADVFRLAGFALACEGSRERAVEIIELGRARELSTWMESDIVDEAALRSLSPSLCDQFFALRGQLDEIERLERLGGAEMRGLDTVAVAEHLATTIDEIRLLPGFERFLTRPSFAEIADTLEPGQAIAYLATSPVGCAVLIIGATATGPTLTDLIANSPDSGRIVRIVLDYDEAAGTMTGYAWGQWAGDEEELERTLEALSEALASTILRPLAEKLRQLDVQTVCLVPAGLLGLLPLHTLSWADEDGKQCLLDKIEVTYAPSAFTEAICRSRAAQRSGKQPHLLAVGNPLPQDPPLPGAEREARMVADLFNEGSTDLFLEEEATRSVVLASLPGATHIHFACHGSASWPDDVLTARLLMANGERITGDDLLAIEDFEPRLVVASACQTGVVQGYETVDQALSLGTVFLGAGAAAAVATLWPIGDYATALLMSRFYEVYLDDDPASTTAGRPAAALRTAQLWLRDLTREAEDRYLSAHPNLRHHRDWSRARDRRRGFNGDTSSPYGSMVSWAPFLVYGA